MKKKILSLVIIFVCNILMLNHLISVVNANDKKINNINMVIVFAKNKIDNNIKNIVVESGGIIVQEIPEVGALEVECSPEVIPEIKDQDSVESISPSHIIKIKKNNIVDANDYYEDKGNSYYEDKGNSYYEDKGNSYYEDKGNSYYENNSTGYYHDGNGDDFDNNFDENDEESIFEGNLYDKYQWDVKRVTSNGESFNIESGNHNVVVGIIDSGVDVDHPDLKKNFLGGKNFIPEGFQNNNTETGDVDDVEDRFGHGTEVAGQIAADGRIKGVAPDIGFKSYRIFDEYGQTTASICADAIIAAVDDNVEVINLSFGAFYLDGQCTWTDKDTGEIYDLGNEMADYSLLERAIKYATDKNVIVVTAAGNESVDCSDNEKLAEYFNKLYADQGFTYSGLMYEAPGDFEGVINVSATDKNDKIASYSNYGQDFIDISAPGGDIADESNISNMCIVTDIEGGYAFSYGTSFSAPKVSGAVALVISKRKDIDRNEVIQDIYDNCEVLDNDDYSEYYGHGLLNIYKILN